MEEFDVNGEAFWAGAETRVFSDPAFGDERAALEERLADEEDLAEHAVFRTSGSEAAAKYVCLSKEALLVSARAVNRHLAAGRSDRWLRALPFFHVGGFAIHARAHAAGNVVYEMEGGWNPERFAECCRENEITLTSLVPAQVHDLVRAGAPLPDMLRAVVVGGGTLPEETGTEARRLGWPVLQSYGLTEAGSQVATTELDSLEETGFRSGKLPLLDIWEARSTPGGVLELKGAALFSAYAWLDESGRLATEDQLAGGWFSTGDRVILEEEEGEKFVTFEEREGEVVKILGELVSLGHLRRRLEDLAAEAGLGKKVALATIREERRGAAFVLAHLPGVPSGDLKGIVESFNGTVRGFERISETREVAEIPRSALGKIGYGALSDLLEKG